MEQFSRLAAPATRKLRQLQKIVQDISNNEGSLLNKLRRLKVTPGPKVPERDYPGEHVEDAERWSDEESDEYEDPQEDADGYEPPPPHRVFTPSSSLPFSRDEYVDSCRNRPDQRPRKPLRPTKAPKPLPPEPHQMASDEEDYIDPEKGNQDNYIDPTEKPTPSVNSSPVVSKLLWKLPCSPVGYKLPLPEENIPPVSRFGTNTQTQPLPPKVSPRFVRPHVVEILEPSSDTEYEVCDPDSNTRLRTDSDPRLLPKPLPREKPPKPVLKPRPPFNPKEHQNQTLPIMNSDLPPPPFTTFTADFGRPMIPLPQILNHHKQTTSFTVENGLQDMDKESDIHRQPWYANRCGRKTAEELLLQSNRDGSFLVRKSSGQDPQQPYTLVVLHNGKVYNIPVRFIHATQQYALGREKKGEERFTSVSGIIENHLKTPLVLIDSQSNTRDTTKLQHAVRP